MSDLIERLRGMKAHKAVAFLVAENEAQKSEIARLREALEYMLRAWDREVGPYDDILFMVKDGVKIRSVQCARAALEQKP